MSNAHETLLQSGLQALSLVLPDDFVGRAIAYCALIQRWNARFNLTAVRDMEGMITRHVLDSLAIAPHVQGPRCLDVGSGAGLPGIPLALANPGQQWVLMEKSEKKSCFLRQVTAELALNNVQIVQKRVEHYACDQGFDTIVSRAVAEVSTLWQWAGHLCAPGGQMLCMTGRYQPNLSAEKGWRLTQQALEVPGLNEPRHVVCLTHG